MHRATKWMFAISDSFAWFLVFACIAGVIAAPFAIPAYAKMTHNDNFVASMVVEVFGLLCVAVGSYVLTKRNYKGIFLVLLPSVSWFISGNLVLAIIYGLFILMLFGVPLSLSYKELASSVHAKS